MKNTVENFVPQGGKHCITNSLKQIFTYYGYPMSEELMFGLASGLSFLHLCSHRYEFLSASIQLYFTGKQTAWLYTLVNVSFFLTNEVPWKSSDLFFRLLYYLLFL